MATLTHLTPGSIFGGDFVVIRRLAEGGMGAVYVVEQRSTGKERALKIMQPEMVVVPEHRARFAAEARMSALIESEHVVEVVGAGVDEATKTPWLAMELLKGEDLAARIRRAGALPPVEAFEVLRQVGHALAAAHRAGLVHRDIKPENIFLATSMRAGQSSVVKVLDFGIAKVLRDSLRGATSTGALGSPLWMAPEQTESRGFIGPQTDVWGLALVTFLTFTGKSFWRAANIPDAPLSAFLREMLIDEIPPASWRAGELGVQSMLPQGFDGWFARCLVRDPAGRFANGAEAAMALAQIAVAPPWDPSVTPPRPPGGTLAMAWPAGSMVPPSTPAFNPALGWNAQGPPPPPPPRRRVWPYVVMTFLLLGAASVALALTLGTGTDDAPAPVLAPVPTHAPEVPADVAPINVPIASAGPPAIPHMTPVNPPPSADPLTTPDPRTPPASPAPAPGRRGDPTPAIERGAERGAERILRRFPVPTSLPGLPGFP